MTSAFSWLRPAATPPPLAADVTARTTNRLPGPDVTRAVALIGVVVMNYNGYLNGVGAGARSGSSFAHSLFDPWRGVLSTRFAATFVLVAGIGVTLLTNRSRLGRDREAVTADRWRLVRRGFLLYAFGFVLDWIWSGTILFYYGAFFMVAALLFTLRTRWILLIGATAALAAAGIAWWRAMRASDGNPVGWLFSPRTLSSRSPRGLLFDTFVNGSHPLLPWLAFLCVGIVIGRLLPTLPRARLIAIGVTLTAVSYAISHAVLTSGADDPVRDIVISTRQADRGVLYTLSNLGTAIVAFCVISWIAERFRDARATRVLLAAGRTTLSLYVLHVLVFRLIVDTAGLVRPTGLDTALTFAGLFWLFAIIVAAGWTSLFGIGPAERLYRRFGG